MYRVAIVEDEAEAAKKLAECLELYAAEKGVKFNIVQYSNGYDFITEYKKTFDLVFMDLEMPYMNGMQVAKELRKIDPIVCLIFVTHLVKYAIRGYEVSALDFILKPLNYNSFRIKMDRALLAVSIRKEEEVLLPTNRGVIKANLSSINYIEVVGHKTFYHMTDGVEESSKTLREVESLLPKGKFYRCNRCYSVNLRNVTHVDNQYVYIGEEKLLLSRPRRKEFIAVLHEYVVNGTTGE